jgi:hypothetical protein
MHNKTLVFGIAAAMALLTSATAFADQFELVYTGSLNSQDSLAPASGSGGAFTTETPFTINALFDTSSPNLAPPSPPLPPPFAGFRAYNPSVATITIGGTTYTIDTIGQNPTAGITVAIFDQNSFTPGRYGIGILQDPPADGAGIVGDFTGASPGFTVDNLVSTVFTGFQGVGVGSGVCLQGIPGNCQLNAVTPLVLHDGLGQGFNLTLGNYAADYPTQHEPNNILGPLNTAELIATPEPATFGVAALALVALGLVRRKRA